MTMMVSSNRAISSLVGSVCFRNASISHLVALIGAAIIDPPSHEDEVRECINEKVTVRLNYSSNVRKASNRSCSILYQTADNTATGNVLNNNTTFGVIPVNYGHLFAVHWCMRSSMLLPYFPDLALAGTWPVSAWTRDTHVDYAVLPCGSTAKGCNRHTTTAVIT